MTVTDVRAQWGVLMQPKNRYRMTPAMVLENSGIVNWLIYLFIYL